LKASFAPNFSIEHEYYQTKSLAKSALRMLTYLPTSDYSMPQFHLGYREWMFIDYDDGGQKKKNGQMVHGT